MIAPGLVLVLLSATGMTAVARAQGAADAKAAAEALFDRGLRLMAEGKLEQACSQLEQSQAIERGIGTMLYLADCYERLGRTASAWALFREAASAANAAGQSERATAGASRAAALESKLSKLTIAVVPEADLSGLTVERGGVVLTRTALGVPIPVDPGEHRITATAPGRARWETQVTVGADAASVVVTVPALAPLPAAPEIAAGPSTGAAPAQATAVSETTRADAFPLRTLGLVVGGAGVIALGVGGYFGLRAIGKNDDAEERCPEPGTCADAEGVEASEDAQDAASLANVFVISGAALAATGVVLYLVAPSEESPALAIEARRTGAALTVGGVF